MPIFTRSLRVVASVLCAVLVASCAGGPSSSLPDTSGAAKGRTVSSSGQPATGHFTPILDFASSRGTQHSLGIVTWTMFLNSDNQSVSITGTDANNAVLWQVVAYQNAFWTNSGFSMYNNRDGSATVTNKGNIAYEKQVANALQSDLYAVTSPGQGGEGPGPKPQDQQRNSLSTANKWAAALALAAAIVAGVGATALVVGAAPVIVTAAALGAAYLSLGSAIAWFIDAFTPPPPGSGGGINVAPPPTVGPPSVGVRFVSCVDVVQYGIPGIQCTWIYYI